jgi:hypothetical protein
MPLLGLYQVFVWSLLGLYQTLSQIYPKAMQKGAKTNLGSIGFSPFSGAEVRSMK